MTRRFFACSVAAVASLAGCAPRTGAPALTVSRSSPAIPVALASALGRIVDPTAGIARVEIAVKLEREGGEAGRAEWTGWVPLGAAGKDRPGFGELDAVLDLLEPRLLADELLAEAGVLEWTSAGRELRGRAKDGGWLEATLDGRRRLEAMRSRSGEVDRFLDVRYDGGGGRVSEVVYREGSVDMLFRWTWDGDDLAGASMVATRHGQRVGAIELAIVGRERR